MHDYILYIYRIWNTEIGAVGFFNNIDVWHNGQNQPGGCHIEAEAGLVHKEKIQKCFYQTQSSLNIEDLEAKIVIGRLVVNFAQLCQS